MKYTLTNRSFFRFIVWFCLSVGLFVSNVDVSLAQDSSSKKSNKDSIENIVFDPLYAPYYAALNETGKKIYKELYDAIVQCKPKITLKGYNFSEVNLVSIAHAVKRDQPELFWVHDFAYMENAPNGVVTSIVMDINYNELVKDLPKHQKLLNDEIQKIIKNANQFKKLTDKELYVHDYLIENTQYVIGSDHHQDIYSVLINHKSVCAGYARTFQVIMRRLGVPTYYIAGHDILEDGKKENHAWNIIMIDGKSYNVDLTNDKAEVSLDDGKLVYVPAYFYFNRTSQDMIAKQYDYEDNDFKNLPKPWLIYPSAVSTEARFENVVSMDHIIKKYSRLFPITSKDIVNNTSEYDNHQEKGIKGPQKEAISLYTIITNKSTYDAIDNYTWADMKSRFLDEATQGWKPTKKTAKVRVTKISDEICLHRIYFGFIP